MSAQTLIIQLARFGDLLQTKRLVKSLQTRSQVHLAVDGSLADLAEIIYPGVVVHALEAHSCPSKKVEDVFRSNVPVIGTIAENEYDLIVNLNFSEMNFSLARIFDPAKVKGYINADGLQQKHAWTRLFFRLAAHRRINPLNLMDFWGLYAPEPISPDRVNPAASGQGQGIGIVLAGKNARRSIPVPALVGLARALRDKTNSSRLVLMGDKAEKPLARQFKDLVGSGPAGDIEDMTGRTGLKDLPDLISSLEMVITPDTGTMHLAAHLGTRVTAFFISSAFCFETGPYGHGHTVFQVMPACAPCMESRKCNFDLVCHDILTGANTFKALCKGADAPMEDAAIFGSFMDDLGVNYLPEQGVDMFGDNRRALRELLRRYLGFDSVQMVIPQEIVRIFYHESQWML